jgi:hypothetical protein
MIAVPAAERVVIAVITSGLGNIFKLNVGWIVQVDPRPGRSGRLILEIGADGGYVVGI